MNKTENVIFQIKTKMPNGQPCYIEKDGHFSFSTFEEAKQIALDFKRNPRINDPEMDDEDIRHWQTQTYVMQERTIITEDLGTI